MELFIRIIDGQPFEHPIFEDNFKEAFPDVDLNNLPSEFLKFVRVEKPILKKYEVCENESTYKIVDGICTDDWSLRLMTEEEKAAKDVLLEELRNAPFGPEWVFDEDFCFWKFRVPYPTDGKQYVWNETEYAWQELSSSSIATPVVSL